MREQENERVSTPRSQQPLMHTSYAFAGAEYLTPAEFTLDAHPRGVCSKCTGSDRLLPKARAAAALARERSQTTWLGWCRTSCC